MKSFKMLSKAELRKVAGGWWVQCPPGLCYNRSIDACDWPSSACAEDTSEGPKIVACYNKKEGDYCVYSLNGTPYGGYCRSFIAGPLHCSDLI